MDRRTPHHRLPYAPLPILAALLLLGQACSPEGGRRPTRGEGDGDDTIPTDAAPSGDDMATGAADAGAGGASEPRDIDGGGVYGDPTDDPVASGVCAMEDTVGFGCMAPLREGSFGMCDGADDDCDGEVDEGCPCTPGEVQRCFRGPPGRRNVGACQDGMQTCEANGEFGGLWGPCEGGIAPQPETCDDLDNDCNGCTDEVEGCVPDGSCPGPDDPRVPEGAPFSTYELRGGEFYPADDAVAWHWEVRGTPCDRMFEELPGSTATSENGQLSYTLREADSENAFIDFTLSGDYEVTLTVEREDGSEFTCTWIIHVRAPGLRVELCWDETGPSVADPMDIDLHLGKKDVTTEWFDDADCDYSSCKGSSYSGDVGWGYADTPIDNCTGPGARGGFSGSCPNPRLDVDNISESEEYVPENINLDNPNDGDEFRVMVHHYDYTDGATRPIVNVYCGGELSGTYGAEPDPVEGFDAGGGRGEGDMWRVTDVRMHVDDSGETSGCALRPITPPGETSGYYVTEDDPTY